MAHPCALGSHVVSVVGALANDDGDAVRNFDALVEQLVSLVGIVGGELHRGDAHGVEHFGGEIVLASIGR